MDNQGRRQTERVIVPPQSWKHLQARLDKTEEYILESAEIIVMTMSHKNTSLDGMPNLQDFSFLQKYSLKLGIKEIGEKGTAATYKEMQQIHH